MWCIRLIRDYCQTQFVDRGMIADIAVHFDDKEPLNPHVHILCTMRSMNGHGEWNDKTKTTYALDENGNRIMGKNGKWKEQRIRDIDAIIEADKNIRESGPILEKYNSIFFKGAKEKYGREHTDEIEKVKKAQRLLYKLKVTQPIPRKALKAESAQLRGEVETMLPALEAVKAKMDQLKTFRSQVRKVLPEALTIKYEDGKKSFEDLTEEIHNEKELRQLLEQSAEQAIRYNEGQRRHSFRVALRKPCRKKQNGC